MLNSTQCIDCKPQTLRIVNLSCVHCLISDKE